MEKYAIGIDYGSTSGRLVLVNICNGQEISELVIEYKHKNMGQKFLLASNIVLHHPQDYLDVLYVGIPQLIKQSSISSQQIISIGIDSTTSTVLAVDNHGMPMCFWDKYKEHPNAYIKLWKDHSAQQEATRINTILEQENLSDQKTSAEWLLPKAVYILNNDPQLYKEMNKFIEVSDWLVWKLTGNEKRSKSQASFTSLWTLEKGYIDKSILKQVDSKLENFVIEKLAPNLYEPFESAGFILSKEAKKLGLNNYVTVSIANIDAISAFPALGVSAPGKMVSVIGTSACHILQSDLDVNVSDAIKVKNGIIPGYYTYISSQVAVGDCFNWFFENMVPYKYFIDATNNKIDIHRYVEDKFRFIRSRENCIALDLWNGSRKNSDLKGLIWGLNINTKPEDIYLALIESTAFGLRSIIEEYEKNNIHINEICAAGGVAHKSPTILQIYANITQKTIKVSRSKNASALGSAIFSAVAAGSKFGGYDDIIEATEKMGGLQEKCYHPQLEFLHLYDQIYGVYKNLYDYFMSI